MEPQILVPIDYSKVSEDVIQIADEWGQRKQGRLFFLHVTHPLDGWETTTKSEIPTYYGEELSSSGKLDHDQLKEFLEPFKIQSPHHTMHGVGKPYQQILEAGKKLKASLIMMAAHSHTMVGRLFLGSNTDYVTHHSHCPIYVHKSSEKAFENKILVPLDYSEVNKPVVKLADEWALRTKAELIFIHVDPEAEKMLARLKKTRVNMNDIPTMDMCLNRFVRPLDVKSCYNGVALGNGTPYTEVLRIQKSLNAGLIIMAAHSHTMAERWFKGSNTDYLLHHADCPMYVYK